MSEHTTNISEASKTENETAEIDKTHNALLSALESVLLISGVPITYKKAAKILKTDEEDVKRYAHDLQKRYLDLESGFAILTKDESLQLVSAPKNAPYVETLVQKETNTKLSQAASEVLAVVLYRGPVSRAEVEEIRGVNCSHGVRQLLIRGLITKSISSHKGSERAVLYSASFEALRSLGIQSLNELPEYDALSRDRESRTSQTTADI